LRCARAERSIRACGVAVETVPSRQSSREDVNAIMLALMRLSATLEEIKESLLEEEDNDEEEHGT
jgi:hypothetical protein